MDDLEQWLRRQVSSGVLTNVVVEPLPPLALAYGAAGVRVPLREAPLRGIRVAAPPPPPAADPPRSRGRSGAAVRALIVGGGWLLFLYWWWIVLQVEGVQALAAMVLRILLGLVVIGVVAGWWIRHNVRIARRGNRGRASRYLPVRFEHDYLGRPLSLPRGSSLAAAAVIALEVDGGVKRYFVAGHEQGAR